MMNMNVIGFEKIVCSSLLVFTLYTACTEAISLQRQILLDIIENRNYDKRIPPGIDLGDIYEEQPTNVSVQLFITEMYDVNVNEMDFSITCYLRQKWVDHRLNFSHPNITLELTQEEINSIWTPDTFFPESKKGDLHTITKPNTLMHIYHNGTVLYSLRLHVQLSCSMDFHLYPLDHQRCKIHLESYGLTATKLLYSWIDGTPVHVMNENLPLYDTNGSPPTDVSLCHTSLFNGGTGFSCLEMVIELKRSIGYYMTEIFIPDILIVVLSWVSFWLHPLAVPGRVSLGAVTVLTMSSQGSASRRNAPRVSYVKAVDVWSLFQIMFVFAALVEFSIVNVLARIKVSDARASQIAQERASKHRESQGNVQDPDKDESRRPYLGRAKKIDKISRIAFPAVYLFFNFLFWVIVPNL
ncbi:glycine receptor subunit alpha-2-like isoform X1 [Mytilus californianus]|uniref:glycine receptor subunit alpha-2-like isoform X1 n=1 Tax=Mytilus californianus TaxID=6549 RepID=UPI002245EC9D|nr:glycine receptor subunit alpha-2-like isoform X1 [Mytilus californianus]XP_052077661.1 glycine receptor subunit alpha-2-like isoform X1 [Mytilus californianus]